MFRVPRTPFRLECTLLDVVFGEGITVGDIGIGRLDGAPLSGVEKMLHVVHIIQPLEIIRKIVPVLFEQCGSTCRYSEF